MSFFVLYHTFNPSEFPQVTTDIYDDVERQHLTLDETVRHIFTKKNELWLLIKHFRVIPSLRLEHL
jgi:hypothetical protein